MRNLILALLTTVLLASCGTEQTGQTYNVIEVCDNEGCRAVNYNMQLNRATADTISWVSMTALADGRDVVFKAIKVK